MITITIILVIVTVIVAMFIHSSYIAKNTVGYRIKKGKHYSIRERDFIKLPIKLGLIKGNRLQFSFMFNGATEYDHKEVGDEINKLYGMSFGFDPNYRSISIGWRHVGNGDIQLFVYSYSDGKRTIIYLYKVKTYSSYTVIITRGTNQESGISLFDDSGNLIAKVLLKVNSVSNWFKFRLYPYFGVSAPKDMVIYITEK